MSDKYPLKGKVVKLCLVGPFEFTGRVEYQDDNRLVLTGAEGSLVIYRSHIIAAMIIDETESEDLIEQNSAPAYTTIMDRPGPPAPQVAKPGYEGDKDDNEQESYYGSIIPADMLIGEDDTPQVDFVMSMSDLKNDKPRGDNKYGTSEKNASNRKENEGGMS